MTLQVMVLADTPPPMTGFRRVNALAIDVLSRSRAFSVIHFSATTHVSHGRPFPRVANILASMVSLTRLSRYAGSIDVFYVPLSVTWLSLMRALIAVLIVSRQRPFRVGHFHSGLVSGNLGVTPLSLMLRLVRKHMDRVIYLDDCLVPAPDSESDSACVVRNPVDPDLADLAAGGGRTLSQDRRPRALFVGKLLPGKGWDIAAEAVRRLNSEQSAGINLTIAGRAPSPAVLGRVRRLAEMDAVSYVGEVRGPQALATLYRNHDVLLLPSTYRHEAQPLVVLEAMCFGLPCIVSPAGALPSTVSPDSGLVTQPTVDDVAESLYHLLCNPASYRRESRLARQRYLQVFSVDAFESGIICALSPAGVGDPHP